MSVSLSQDVYFQALYRVRQLIGPYHVPLGEVFAAEKDPAAPLSITIITAPLYLNHRQPVVLNAVNVIGPVDGCRR